MTACDDYTLLINGLIDGELDAANTLRVETHIAQCSGCNAAFHRLRDIRDRLTDPALRYQAPRRLAERVRLMAEELPAHRRIVGGWLVPGVAGALAASLALTILLPQGVWRARDSGIEQQLVSSHVRSLLANHLTDVQTSNRHVVKPWFNGKIDFAPPVPELLAQGFPLIGGRLDYIGGRVVPALVYRRNLHTVNLFIWPAASGPTGVLRKDSYSIDEWSAGGLRFAAVSDVEPTDLERFRLAYEAATVP